jgi:hypothetical protein
MIRRFTMLTAILLATGGALFAPSADAQGAPTCDLFPDYHLMANAEPDTGENTTGSAEGRVLVDCADAVAYPGPFTNMPTVPLSPHAAANGIVAAPPQPVTAPAAEPTPGLAHSGSEIAVLAYLGTGLVAFGAFALGIRRGNPSE